MLIGLVGLKEPGNHFKHKIAAKFNCPVFSFAEASRKFYESLAPVFGVSSNTSSRMGEEIQLVIRNNITDVHPKFYADWMMNHLVENVFRREDNSSKKLQGIILDIVTPWEYKVFRSFLINNTKAAYGAPKKVNRMILIENEALYGSKFNQGYVDYLDFEVDATISSEDDECDIDEAIKYHLAKWNLGKEKCPR